LKTATFTQLVVSISYFFKGLFILLLLFCFSDNGELSTQKEESVYPYRNHNGWFAQCLFISDIEYVYFLHLPLSFFFRGRTAPGIGPESALGRMAEWEPKPTPATGRELRPRVSANPSL
jgi:hypothetical protein